MTRADPNKDEFFITLLSDSNLNYYPENTTCSFSVILPQTLHLSDDFRVAATSIVYPQTIQNITPYNNSLILEMDKFVPNAVEKIFKLRVIVNLPYDHYSNIFEVIDILNENVREKIVSPKKEDPPILNLFTIDENKRRIIIDKDKRDLLCKYSKKKYDGSVEKCHMTRLYLEGKLGLICGFNPDTHNLLNDNETVANFPYNINLGFPSLFFIYADFIESQNVGDKLCQVLKICPGVENNSNFGDVIQRIGAFLSGIFRNVIPLLKSGGISLGREFLRGANDVLTDVANNKDFKNALKTRGLEVADKLAHKFYGMNGHGYKKDSILCRNRQSSSHIRSNNTKNRKVIKSKSKSKKKKKPVKKTVKRRKLNKKKVTKRRKNINDTQDYYF
ncbi:unnamed protein product [Chironomus riparius]|uniref:Uncharacterized protein n=1 Tax=Chironomus riparius TaxID=315576 RepID=A0A9N9RSG5_9DIPT|nr:unnamed protein product [Chironomus riparius]